jgi:hypothetical protein
MYGLVNRAIEQLVVSMKGENGWRGVCAHANIPSDGFVSMQAYDDEITYRLVGAVSARLGLAQEMVLEAFGEYWITYTATEGYGNLMDAGGNNLREFLGNLNDMHGRVETVFPQLRMPQFRVQELSATEFHLHYNSTREGLAPFVLGLVKGLAKRFDQTIEITQTVFKANVQDEDVFLVRLLDG